GAGAPSSAAGRGRASRRGCSRRPSAPSPGRTSAGRRRISSRTAVPARPRRRRPRRPRRAGAGGDLRDAAARGRAPAGVAFAPVGEEQKVPYEELLATAREAYDGGTDLTLAVEEEFALLDP